MMQLESLPCYGDVSHIWQEHTLRMSAFLLPTIGASSSEVVCPPAIRRSFHVVTYPPVIDLLWEVHQPHSLNTSPQHQLERYGGERKEKGVGFLL